MSEELDKLVEKMRAVGEQLITYTFPQADMRLEDEINILKINEIFIDGYWLVIHYNKADYKTHFLETVQIFGKNFLFLPFSVIVKVAKKFLGGHNLLFTEVIKENRKIYCWAIMLDRTGRPMDYSEGATHSLKYGDIEYKYWKADIY